MELFEVKQEPTNHCEDFLFIFLKRHTNVSFLTEINVRFMKRKIILDIIFFEIREVTLFVDSSRFDQIYFEILLLRENFDSSCPSDNDKEFVSPKGTF